MKVSCKERQINGPPAVPTLAPVSSRLPADTHIDGLDLYFSVTFQSSIISTPATEPRHEFRLEHGALVCGSRVVLNEGVILEGEEGG